jgi:alkylation response protein AidB-like acyl-CoA dehydrogenase
MTDAFPITGPDGHGLDELCDILAGQADAVDQNNAWPEDQLASCANYGVYRWFLSPDHGGLGWDEADLMRGYLRLSAACLTTTFIITQATGAIRRIAASASEHVRSTSLPPLVAGRNFTTLGISHLTTSRRHLGRPALRAEETTNGFRLEGYSPWVTGGMHADWIVTGAQMDDGRQLLAVVPSDLPGVSCDEPTKLVALSASHTGAVRMDNVLLDREWLLAGPVEDVMKGASGARTGGLQTSALALGLAGRAIDFLQVEARQRLELVDAAEGLRQDHAGQLDDLLAMASGEQVCSSEALRASANSLCLRATQAAFAAAKGTGYVQGHPAGRWCREALFFLVWSCPQPVMAANLCELAGIEGELEGTE